jgi:hypothetical protein
MKYYTRHSYDQKRASSKPHNYVSIMNYKCSNPECPSGYDVEGHHIQPLKKGGEDVYWNLVSLCRHCHHSLGLHHRWEEVRTELYVWKSMQELEQLGFCLDEKESDFQEKLTKAILRSNTKI